MGKLSELVKRDYDEGQLEVIKDTGNIWVTGVVLIVALFVFWITDHFLWDEPWSKRDIGWAIISVLVGPFL